MPLKDLVALGITSQARASFHRSRGGHRTQDPKNDSSTELVGLRAQRPAALLWNPHHMRFGIDCRVCCTFFCRLRSSSRLHSLCTHVRTSCPTLSHQEAAERWNYFTSLFVRCSKVELKCIYITITEYHKENLTTCSDLRGRRRLLANAPPAAIYHDSIRHM